MERRMSNSPAVLAERARIVLLWLGGSSARSISQQTGASLSTVYRWIHRWQDDGSVETKPYHRRLRKIPWTDKKGHKKRNIVESPMASAKREKTINFPLTSKSQILALGDAMSTPPPALSQLDKQFEESGKKPNFQISLYSKVVQQGFPQRLWRPTSFPFFKNGFAD
ncbi:hypothetical protein Pmani_015029 [Petrolisthes manimaculis]|uniref:Uncharacterized protein n=1 Tax=Petrolisthes manimaculis TaxID=1843537 RepID=A0AAE1UC07_9EUCA|nr:hypothetical protein Pmani_015029 [Petrolisthes manimaculis]